MHKNVLAYFFTLTLVAALLAPAIISVIEDSCDVSIVMDWGEEESKEKDIKTLEFNTSLGNYITTFSLISATDLLYSSCQLHSIFHLENISPPPEFII